MKTLLVFAVCLAVASAQIRYTVESLNIKPTTERGYIEVTLTSPLLPTLVGPVCGEVNIATAFVVCQTNGWIASVDYGTAGEYGLDVSSTPVAENLACFGYSNIAGTSAYNCTIDVNGNICSGNEVATVSCYFTVGQIVGIAIGGFLLCALIIALPFILCCICCCCGICCAASG